MTDSLDTVEHIAELLVHVGRASRTDGGRGGLTAAQWTGLRFLARANSISRTPSAFASFQATTRGTASQIIKTLERRGLIARRRSSTDGRSVRFDLTPAGWSMLTEDPLGDLNRLLGAMESPERLAFLATLSRLSSSLAAVKNAPAFGTCRDCRHYTPSPGIGFCACLAAAVDVDDIDLLCASYRCPPGTVSPYQNESRPNDRT